MPKNLILKFSPKIACQAPARHFHPSALRPKTHKTRANPAFSHPDTLEKYFVKPWRISPPPFATLLIEAFFGAKLSLLIARTAAKIAAKSFPWKILAISPVE